MDIKEYKAAIEAMLFAYAEPISSAQIALVLEVETNTVDGLIKTIQDDLSLSDRGIELIKIDGRWQFCTKSEYGEHIKKLMDTRRNAPLSQAAMEVLAIIAYNQPVSRSFIEQVRGVDSSHTVHTLMIKGLIEEAGRLDLPGKPVSFKTSDVFLRSFGLSSLQDLPQLHSEDGMTGLLDNLEEVQSQEDSESDKDE